jgi:hypothetical protein
MPNTTPTRRHSRSRLFGSLLACALAQLGAGRAHADNKPQPPVTATMQYLAHLPADAYGELALGKLFANGTATYVPVGDGTGYPVLFHSIPELDALASQLWGGKTFRVVSGATQPNGDPIVELDNKIIKTPDGGLFNLFNAYVTRNPISQEPIGKNGKGEVVPAPVGALAPVKVSFLKEGVFIDDKPSVWLNYFGDTTLPIIRRILDEIREIDGVNCKGLFLGRAHVRRCTSWSCGEVPSAIVDDIESWTTDTRYQWNFWTYFILNFGQPAGQTCDISAAIQTAQAQLRAQGYDVTLPALPASN